ncbi:MAG TPA: protein kinase, partial [Pyrinomonadaceae bacterium]|nr:protein kinase [Pyrinomonadaceae bacterium]
LLTADAGNENFLTSPAFEFAAGMLANEAAEFAAGERVGRYEILCSLGAGGMGQIYLARDAQLGRNIALKLISQEFATDTERVRRFEQEARAASALNHPNVCVIHEIGITDQGRHFIAMEYIQGATLRDHLAHGPRKPLEALQIAIQVGTALASAHAVGIVHRDIKPENIMLRPDGYVKVVDFGLAKLTEGQQGQLPTGETQTIIQTEARMLMGTVKYMSPEQLREVPVDEQTDVWSLGVVLYEMLTGSTPFESRSRNDSVASILKAEPAQLTFPETVPVHYRKIVTKALEKDCNKRYQTISKLISDLSTIKRELEHSEGDLASVANLKSSPIVYTPVIGKHPRRAPLGSTLFTRFKSQAISTADSLFRTHRTAALFAGISSAIFLVLLLPSVARWVNKPGKSVVNTAQETTATVSMPIIDALTNAGTSRLAAISPDGRLVAHVEEQKGKQQLIVTSRLDLASRPVVPADDVEYVGITFSPDNNIIYFTRKEKNEGGILYRLALPGSNPTKVKSGVDSPITFSPQGDRFAFVRQNRTKAEYLLMLSDVDGSNEQVLASRKDGDRFSTDGPAWSPDGSMVVCPAGHWGEESYRMNLFAFDVKDGRQQLIAQQSWLTIFQVTWEQDGNSLVVNAREHDASRYELWRVGFPDGTAQKLTPDLENYQGVSIAGGKIVTARSSLNWRLWIANIGESEKAVDITSGTGIKYGLSWTSNGTIVYSSMTPDRLNISRIDPDGSNRAQLTTGGDNYLPESSPDGRYIVFSSNLNGRFNIWRMNANGHELMQLTSSDGNFYPSVSPDNQWVVYDNVTGPVVKIFKVPLSGGEPIKIGERYRMPVFSPTSQFIAARYNLDANTEGVAIFSAQGGEPVRLFEIPSREWQRVRWISNNELSYIKDTDGYSNIWSYNLDTGERKQLTNFNSDRIYAYAWSPDYKQIACQRGSTTSNVTMITER